MNEKYWKEFYKYKRAKNHRHTPFAEFCLGYIDIEKPLIDFGCGNGRDTYYFARQGIKAFGVDKAVKPKNRHGAKFYQQDFKKFQLFSNNQVYGRFFLHAIENMDIVQFLERCGDLVMLEFRNKGDSPEIYKGHKRTTIDGRDVFEILMFHNYKILHYQVSHGLAVYKGEDPLICRIIATKRY